MEGTERTEILLREEQYLFASQERMVGGIQPEGPGHIQPADEIRKRENCGRL